jgi:hypothetical protein
MSDDTKTGQLVPLDRIVKTFLKIRDYRSEKKRAFEAEDDALKEEQELLQSQLLKYMNEAGLKNFGTEFGTVFRSVNIQPTASDWDTFYTWVAETDGFDFLEKRIKKTSVAAYMEQNMGAAPPGVNVLRNYEVTVRRKN